MKCAYYACLVIGQLICHSVYCQFYFSANNRPEPELLWEIGASAGAMNCLTDIGGINGAGKKFIKDINWNQTQWAGSLFADAVWHYLFGIRLEAGLGRVAGNDDVLKNSSGIARSRYLRNLQFRTNIIELAVLGELYPLMLIDNNHKISLLSAYIIAGAGLFNYNPQAWLNNTWIDLRPLHTEGQGFKEYPNSHLYKPNTWCLPLGAGIKYDAARLINLRLEVLYRFTGTDYLDDVSRKYIDPSLFGLYLSLTQSAQAGKLADRSTEITAGIRHPAGDKRGNPSNRDAYFSFTLKASIVLGRIERK